MSETNAQEPTMEEILASIRRIISEDEAPAAAPEAEAEDAAEAPAPSSPAPSPSLAVVPPSPPADEVLELTEKVEPAPPPPPAAPAPPPSRPAASLGDLDFSDAQVAPPPPPRSAPAPRDTLVSDHAATAAAGHFGQLAQSLAMPATGRTLEDVVREMLKPLLKDWLDQHLPKIVEAAVQTEVERISRRGGY